MNQSLSNLIIYDYELIDQLLNSLCIDKGIISFHLAVLLKSILDVTEDNLWFTIKGSNIEQVERSFTYELYRLWKNKLMVLNSINQKQYESLTINAEVSKTMQILSSDKDKYVFPDFVLHKGQSDLKQENQLFICEVKRSNLEIEGIKKDFSTFEYLMKSTGVNNSFNFAYAFFIIANKNLETEKEQILESFKFAFDNKSKDEYIHAQTSKSIDQRIVCISYNLSNKNRELQIATIEQIKNDQIISCKMSYTPNFRH